MPSSLQRKSFTQVDTAHIFVRHHLLRHPLHQHLAVVVDEFGGIDGLAAYLKAEKIDLVLDANWGTGRLVRSYTMLFDPPALRRPAPAVTASPQVSRISRAWRWNSARCTLPTPWTSWCG